MLRRLWLWLLQLIGFDPRGIFRFYDGRRYRNCDPMELTRKYWSINVDSREIANVPTMMPFDPRIAQDLIKSGEPLKIQRGYAIVADAVREIFEVKPLKDGGLTDVECDALLQRFEWYIGALKKNGKVLPTTAPSMDTTEKEPTKSGLGSGSTSIGSIFVLPDISGLEPQLVARLDQPSA